MAIWHVQTVNASTHGQPDEQWEGLNEAGHVIKVACWKGLHVRKARGIKFALIGVIRHGASDQARDSRESWFLWTADDSLSLGRVHMGYKRRY